MKRVCVIALIVLVLAGPGSASYEIIVDNPDAVFVGAWTTSSLTATRYGADYRYCNVSTSNGRTGTYQPNIPVTSNDWEVYTWYPSGTNRTTAAQFIIHHAGVDDIVYVNQQQNGGGWLYLGAYTMNAGTENYVRITNYGTDGKLVMADAVRFYSAQLPPEQDEFRAMWAQTWIDGFLSAGQITELVNTAYSAHYNVVIPEVRKCGDAYYDSEYEPRATNIIDPLPFDPLQDCIDKAHAVGIEVHPWIVTYRIWRNDWGTPPPGHMWALHPEWVDKDWSGNILDGSSYNLDPGIPGVQDYVCKVVKDLITKYDVDGLNFDYIRYPNPEWGYNDVTKQRFYDEYGYWPPTSTSDSHWGAWSDYRRQQVTDLVKKCYLEVMAVKPHIKVSVCGTGRMGANPNTNYTQTGQYRDVLQNSKGWMEQHIIDIDMLMNYKRDHLTDQKADFRLWADWLGDIAASTGRHSVCGQAAYLNTIANSVIQMQYARDAGCQGGTTYSYQDTNSESLPNSDFYDSVRTNLYHNAVPTPDMPWKSAPTTGIIFGNVTNATLPNDPIYQNWIYQATVTVTGPVTQSTQTDATGTFGFIDLPLGTYTVSCSKTGFATRTYTAQTILAGDVLREDFDLGTVSISSPASVIYQAGKSLFSLPYDPIDPAPATVMGTIPIDGRLIQWHRATQSSRAYDEWDPGFFGDLSLDQGYWLTVASAHTISYQAYGASSGSRTQSCPKAGWNIIGCPFPAEHKWADMRVTSGSTTVSLEQARNNGWVNSVGIWWDSVNQSSRDVGLPDDYCFTDNLQPWHGHWFKTYVDNLILTQR